MEGMSGLSNDRTMSVMMTRLLKPPVTRGSQSNLLKGHVFKGKWNFYFGCLSFSNCSVARLLFIFCLIFLAQNHFLVFSFLSVGNLELLIYINKQRILSRLLANVCFRFEFVQSIVFLSRGFCNFFLDLSVNDNWITPVKLSNSKLLLMQMKVNPEFFV